MSEYCKYYLTKSLYKVSNILTVLYIVCELSITRVEIYPLLTGIFSFSLNEYYFLKELEYRKNKIRTLKKNK